MTQREADARLGRAIRTLRRDRGLTLVRVAAASGLSQPFLSQLELGRSRPSMRSLFRIAEALGTTQQALLAQAAPIGQSVTSDEGTRLLLHGPGADVTEFAGLPADFGEYFRHDRDELLYVVRGSVELELRENGHSRLHTLAACDSVRYAGSVEHRFRRSGPGECVVLVVHSGG